MSQIPELFYQNEVLFGHDATPNLIAFETEGLDQTRIFQRQGDSTVSELVPFRPFLLLEGDGWLQGWKGEAELKPLAGGAPYNRIASFPGLRELEQARSYIQKKSGKSASAPEAPYLHISDPVHQYLLLSGKTQFLSMTFGTLKRLQIRIETYCQPGFEFPNPARASDRITAIALGDSTGWEMVLSGRDYDEGEMLSAMVREIRARDPDVIEGHNLFRFDFEYMEARARRCGVELRLGRDGGLLKGHSSRMQVAEKTIAYRKYEIFGRHVIDTWILSQHYDVAARELEGYSLGEVARHFGIEEDEPHGILPERSSWSFDHDPEGLCRSALDGVRKTRALAEILSPSYFVEAQIFPYSYQNVALRGNATKIDSLFLREYLYRGRSIPRPEEAKDVVGGYTDMEHQGVARHVLHCDITSLYPSIMLVYGTFPKKDELRIVPGLLTDLRQFRIQAKELARKAATKEARVYFSALQSTFKILINSFYGYLGFPMGHFNDFDAANQVTAKGRELIRSVVAWLKERGAMIIEVDTDGIYFVPPSKIQAPGEEDNLIQELAAILPQGIELELDGRYPSMFSYKMKNYALLETSGRLHIKGSGLRSRGLELFQRRWMEEILLLLLKGEGEKIQAFHQRYLEDLENHRLDITQLMKTETLQDSLETYQMKLKLKKRNPAAPYEIALRSQRPYQPGDQISYYVTGKGAKIRINENCKLASQWDPENPDENVEHYKAKLNELYEKFRGFIEPQEAGNPEARSQSSEDEKEEPKLFDSDS